jgi:hypothetical protein
MVPESVEGATVGAYSTSMLQLAPPFNEVPQSPAAPGKTFPAPVYLKGAATVLSAIAVAWNSPVLEIVKV